MTKDIRVYLGHILESIELIEEYTRNVSEETFYIDTELQDSVIRRLEIIGEAIKCMPDDVRENNERVDWRGFAGMRDKLIHEYFGVDIKLIWNVVVKELPTLKREVEALLNTLS
jgi:uncharacterized protein with HEPN domain